MKKAMQKLDLLVVVDPYPSAMTAMAAMHGRKERRLPAAGRHAVRDQGSVTASNRSLQWREKVIEPLFECKTDHEIMYQLAEKLGFGKELVKNIKVKVMDEPVPEDILREINRRCWTIGYTGCSRSA
jgi:formate dehydrogenase major subunit